MLSPWRNLLCSLATLASLLGACHGQQLRQVYPWGPETAWTRYNWPELKLRFPFEHLQRTDVEPDHLLHSANGPHDGDFYRRLAEDRPERPLGGMLHTYFSGKEALVRCTTCNILQATVWGQIRVKLHKEGVLMNDKDMHSQLAYACAEQVPEVMRSVGAISQQVAEMLAGGGGTPFPAGVHPSKVAKLCNSLLEVPENGETKSIMDALHRGLRLYASRLNARTRPKSRVGYFDDRPVEGNCEDYHSACGKWAMAEECDRNPGYMVGDGDGAVGHCKASCGTCLARLTSGELPSLAQSADLDADLLGKVQFQGCNASGICNGVDLGLLPKITSVSLTPEDLDGAEDLVRGGVSSEKGGLPSPAARESDPADSINDLIKLASKFPNSQCFQRTAGWWTYELCPGVHMKQIHVDQEGGDVQQVIDMGFWEASRQPQSLEDLVVVADQAAEGDDQEPVYYLRSLYTDGSLCNLDDQGTVVARETEVRMACSTDEKTYLSTTEPSKCRYIVVVLTPELCPEPKEASRTWSKAAKSLFRAEL